jgi:hypothetical protein
MESNHSFPNNGSQESREYCKHKEMQCGSGKDNLDKSEIDVEVANQAV